MKAKQVILLAWGSHKAQDRLPLCRRPSALTRCPLPCCSNIANCKFVIDEQAALELTRNKEPWLTGDCEWTPKLIRKAVTNLALKLEQAHPDAHG